MRIRIGLLQVALVGFVVAVAMAPSRADASLICIKTKVKSNGNVKFKTRAVESACPGDFSPLLDTANLGTEFPGPRGEPGTEGW